MAVTGKLYGKVFTALWNKEIDYDSDAIACTLHTSAYTPDQDVHDYVDDLTNEVAAAGGYSTGGQNLASKTVTYTGATNKHVLDAADVTWATATITARTAVLSDRTPGTAATQPLIAYQNSDADVISSGGDFVVQWNASGIVEITVG
jgi:hypothetical protein